MKRIIGITLTLALILGTAAFAEENTEATNPVPAVTEEVEAVPTEDAEAAPTEGSAEAEAAPDKAEAVPAEDDAKAFQDALEAYRFAKQDKAVEDLEEELNGYVEASTLTQEQADLILKNVKDKMAQKNGERPNRGCNKGVQRGQQGQQGQQMPQQRGNQMPQQRGNQMPGNQQRGNQQRGQQNQQGQMPQQPGNQMPGQQMPQQRPDAQSGATPRR